MVCTRLRLRSDQSRRRRGLWTPLATAEERAAGRAHAARHAAREVLEVVGAREADQAAVGGTEVPVRVLVQWCCLGRRLGRVWHRFPRCSVGRHRLRCVWRRAIAVAAGKRLMCTLGSPRCNHTVRIALMCEIAWSTSKADERPSLGPTDLKSFSPFFAPRIRRAPGDVLERAETAPL